MPRIDRCPQCKRRLTRSSDANRRYWALLHVMAEQIKPAGVRYSADQWHLYAKSRWIGCDDMTLPNHKTIPVPRSSADLDTTEFNDYMTAVEAFANERGCFLEDAENAA